jgi:malonyl-CoA/methylmalonyl-CoA synthetase
VPEALHYSRTVGAHAILTSSAYTRQAWELQQQLAQELDFRILETTPLLWSPVIDMRTIRFQSGRVFDQNKPAVVIFTSGSTGPPKGVALRRYMLFYSAYSLIRAQGMGAHTRTIQFLPTHHATGLLFNTIPTLVAGGCVEFDQGNFDPASVWERIRSGELKTFSAVPTIYVRLLRHWDAVLSKRADKQEYLKALSKISYFASSTSAVNNQTFTQWQKLSGKAISERYGGSEFGNVYLNPPGLTPVPVCRSLYPWVHFVRPDHPRDPWVLKTLRASRSWLTGTMARSWFEGLCYSPSNYSPALNRVCGLVLTAGHYRYMNDPVATYNSFDSEGFYKTGDIGRREGNVYFIEGRASVDSMPIVSLFAFVSFFVHPTQHH